MWSPALARVTRAWRADRLLSSRSITNATHAYRATLGYRAVRISVPLAHGRVLLGVDEAPQLRESRRRIVPGPVERCLRRCLQLLLKNALGSRGLCHLDDNA